MRLTLLQLQLLLHTVDMLANNINVDFHAVWYGMVHCYRNCAVLLSDFQMVFCTSFSFSVRVANAIKVKQHLTKCLFCYCYLLHMLVTFNTKHIYWR